MPQSIGGLRLVDNRKKNEKKKSRTYPREVIKMIKRTTKSLFRATLSNRCAKVGLGGTGFRIFGAAASIFASLSLLDCDCVLIMILMRRDCYFYYYYYFIYWMWSVNQAEREYIKCY